MRPILASALFAIPARTYMRSFAAVLRSLSLAIIGLAGVPSHAQEPRMSLAGPDGHCFAVVLIENRAGSYNRDETLETPHGTVVVNYRTVGGHQPGADDQVQVMELPDGVTAVPMRMDLPDGDTGRICLMEYLGF